MPTLTKADALPIATRIIQVRGLRVMLDADLAAVYDVSTRTLNQAVQRNRRRFPSDFAFHLTLAEAANLRSQIVISRSRWGGSRYVPWAFTEHGAMMAAAVLNTPRATTMSVFVVRAFIHLRDVVRSQAGVARRLEVLEKKVGTHDRALRNVIVSLRQLIVPPPAPRRPIGFAAPGAS